MRFSRHRGDRLASGDPEASRAGRYARWAVRHPWTVLAAGLAACVLAAFAARHLRVSSDLAALLPDDTPSVANLRLAAERLGSTDLLYVAVQSPDPDANHRYLDSVASVVSRWPEHPLVLHKLAAGYFVDHALYYVDLADLEAIRENLRRRIEWEKVHSNPAYIDLEDSVPPDIVPPALREKYEQHRLVKLLTGRDEKDANDKRDHPGLGAVEDAYLEREVEVTGDGRGPSVHETVSVLAVRFRSSTVDIDFARRVVTRAECLIGARVGSECRDLRHWPGAKDLPPEARVVLDPHAFHPRMRVDSGGAIRTRVRETQALIADGTAAAWRSLGVMAAVVFLSFRRLRALAYVLAPLVVGTTLCLALAVVLLPQLNVITVFTFAILVGMGIDFGIHLGKRYEEERAAGNDHERATVRTLGRMGRPMMVAMLTTVICFALLMTSSLPAFREFGELSALGLPLSMLTAYALFPAIATLGERLWPMRVRRVAPGAAARSSSPAFSLIGSIVVLVAALASVVVAVSAASGLRFEYDSSKLGTRRQIAPTVDARYATRGYTASLMLAVAGSPEQAREVERLLSPRIDAPAERLRAVLGLSSFVPDEQERKSLVLRAMDRMMDEPSFGFYEDDLSDEEFEDLQEWRRRLRAQPVDAAATDFPRWARDLFVERDGRTAGNVVYLVPDANMGDARDARDMQRRYQVVRLPSGATVPVAATGFVYADVVFGMRQEAPWLTGLAALGILAIVLIALRNPWRALITLAPLAVGLAWLFGLMAAFDVNLTFYATVILPVVLGTGIDGAVYLHWRYLELGPGSVLTALRRTAPPVLLSSITTMAGFGSLLFAHHDGLGSMALVAMLGLGCMLAAVLLTLPPLLRVLEGRRDAPVPETAGLPEVP